MAISSSLSVVGLLLISLTLISAQAPTTAPMAAPKAAPVPAPVATSPTATAPVASPPAPPAGTPTEAPTTSAATPLGSPESGISFSSPPKASAPAENAAVRSVVSSIGFAGALLIVATAF